MKRSRFVRPETRRLPLTDDDWILVRKRLTAGEERAMYGRMYRTGVTPGSGRQVDVLQTGLAMVVAYLLDWSLTDDAGEPVGIAGVPAEDLVAVLDNLDTETFREIKQAIEAHEAAMTAERAEEKKSRSGAPLDGATSSWPSAAAGGSSGSATLMPTTTGSSSS